MSSYQFFKEIDLPDSVFGLMQSLPPPCSPMTKDERDRWLKAMEAALEYAYPEKNHE